MLRRFIRFYYRLRYFPRHIFEALTGISNAIAGLHRHEQVVIDRLLSVHEERLTRVHEEIAAFCDDAIRAMMAASASIAGIDTRIQALQHGLQRLENGTTDAQGRLAALQQALHPADGQAGAQAADPETFEALMRLVQHQAASLDRIETLVMEQARSLPAPANAALASRGPGHIAGDDGRLSRA